MHFSWRLQVSKIQYFTFRLNILKDAWYLDWAYRNEISLMMKRKINVSLQDPGCYHKISYLLGHKSAWFWNMYLKELFNKLLSWIFSLVIYQNTVTCLLCSESPKVKFADQSSWNMKIRSKSRGSKIRPYPLFSMSLYGSILTNAMTISSCPRWGSERCVSYQESR